MSLDESKDIYQSGKLDQIVIDDSSSYDSNESLSDYEKTVKGGGSSSHY